MEFTDRPFAFTDLETSGDDPMLHEILEIGLAIVDQQTLKIIDTYNAKIRPHHIEVNVPAALERNGYNETEWKDAIELEDAMKIYSEKTKNAIFVAFNVSFDWSFIKEAFRKTGAENKMDYHRLDVLTAAWFKCAPKGLKKFNLKEVSKFLGVPPEPDPHRALDGALTAFENFKKLTAN